MANTISTLSPISIVVKIFGKKPAVPNAGKGSVKTPTTNPIRVAPPKRLINKAQTIKNIGPKKPFNIPPIPGIPVNPVITLPAIVIKMEITANEPMAISFVVVNFIVFR